MSTDAIWLSTGLVAQGLFTARFLVQWIVSERRGRSEIPVLFWHLSLAGGLLLTGYAMHQGDPVFIMGQSAGLVVYVRNLMLLRAADQRAARQAIPEVPEEVGSEASEAGTARALPSF